MNILLRAVVTGFGLSVGAAIYKRVAQQLGLEDKDKEKQEAERRAAGAAASDDGALHGAPGTQPEA